MVELSNSSIPQLHDESIDINGVEMEDECVGDAGEASSTMKKRKSSLLDWFDHFVHDTKKNKVICKYCSILNKHSKKGDTSIF